MLAAGGQLDGGGAAKSGRVVILRSGWNVDHDGFGVAANVNPVLLAFPRPREAVQRGADGHGHGARTANAGAGRGLRIGRQRESPEGAEELGDFGKEWKAEALGFHERGK